MYIHSHTYTYSHPLCKHTHRSPPPLPMGFQAHGFFMPPVPPGFYDNPQAFFADSPPFSPPPAVLPPFMYGPPYFNPQYSAAGMNYVPPPGNFTNPQQPPLVPYNAAN